MTFSIITPTYKRPAELMCAVQSVINQSVPDWEMVIVNDNPDDGATDAIAALGDSRIHILQNDVNRGVNYSRNRGLDSISPQSTWIIFLDDDDTLSPDALARLSTIITRNPSNWIVTARGPAIDTPKTEAPKNIHYYSYTWDYLIARRFKGDATHCIKSSLITNTKNLRFPTQIKQGEEWIFYSHLGTQTSFYYENIVTTLSTGYAQNGLNLRRRSTHEQLRLIPTFFKEAKSRNLYTSPLFWVYIMMRTVRAFIK